MLLYCLLLLEAMTKSKADVLSPVKSYLYRVWKDVCVCVRVFLRFLIRQIKTGDTGFVCWAANVIGVTDPYCKGHKREVLTIKDTNFFIKIVQNTCS